METTRHPRQFLFLSLHAAYGAPTILLRNKESSINISPNF